MHGMHALAEKQLEQLTLDGRAQVPRAGEIRQALARTGRERYADLVGEVRDIVAAEERVAAGRYGICIDCGDDIGYERLKAYPSAKRCLSCQQHREKTRKPSQYTGR